MKQSGYNSSAENFDQQLSIKMKKTKSSHFGGGNELSGSSSAAGKGFEIIELDEVDKIYDPNNPLKHKILLVLLLLSIRIFQR